MQFSFWSLASLLGHSDHILQTTNQMQTAWHRQPGTEPHRCIVVEGVNKLMRSQATGGPRDPADLSLLFRQWVNSSGVPVKGCCGF